MWAFRQTILAGLALSLTAGSVVVGAGAGFEFRELASLEAGAPGVDDCKNCSEEEKVRRAEELVCGEDEENQKCKDFREHVSKSRKEGNREKAGNDDFMDSNWGLRDLFQVGAKALYGEYRRKREKNESRRIADLQARQARQLYIQGAQENNFSSVPGASSRLLDYSRTANGTGRDRGGSWSSGDNRNGPLDMRIQSGTGGGLPMPGASVLSNPGGGLGRGGGSGNPTGGMPNIQ